MKLCSCRSSALTGAVVASGSTAAGLSPLALCPSGSAISRLIAAVDGAGGGDEARWHDMRALRRVFVNDPPSLTAASRPLSVYLSTRRRCRCKYDANELTAIISQTSSETRIR